MRFETPLAHRIGDCLVLLLAAPVVAGLLWLLLLLPCMLVAAGMAKVLGLGVDGYEAAMMAALAPAAVAAAWLLRGKLGWSLTLTARRASTCRRTRAAARRGRAACSASGRSRAC